jgi:YgiT-type zinc finger domain-containing protein
MSPIPTNGKRIGKRERKGNEMLEKCFFCKARVIQQQVTFDYRWGDSLVVIKDVPAGVCQQCGEKYLTSGVYKELEKLAKSKSHLMGKMTVEILAFEESRAA